MKKLILASLLFLNAQAWAGSCLERVSNVELLNEVSYRMSTGNYSAPELPDYSANFFCKDTQLSINLLDISSGQEQSVQIPFTFSHTCNYVSALLAKKVGTKITKTTVVAFCKDTELNRLMFSEKLGLKELPKTTFTFNRECTVEADKLNEVK